MIMVNLPPPYFPNTKERRKKKTADRDEKWKIRGFYSLQLGTFYFALIHFRLENYCVE